MGPRERCLSNGMTDTFARAWVAVFMAAWLFSYPDGAVRSHLCGLKGRRRLRLPAVSWLRESLQRHGGPGYDKQVLSELCVDPVKHVSPSDLRVEGIVKLSQEGCSMYTDLLSCFSKETLLQQQYHHTPIDAYEMLVEDAAALADGQSWTVTHMLEFKNKNFGNAGQALVSAGKPLFFQVGYHRPAERS